MSSSSTSAPHAARIAGRYEVEALLGKGGMAAVYRALDGNTGQRVALKQLLLTAQQPGRQVVEALFEQEFRTLSELSHPRVIGVFDYGVEQGQPFYTMELLDGGDLNELAPLAWREACRVMFDVCSSLAMLHARRLLHRDVSPRNVRYTSDGHAKLIDFGVMSPMGYRRQIVGTPAFAAPEVVYRLALDARTDLFSVGATLYYALTGRAPYRARNFDEVIEAWRHKPAPPSRTAHDVPPELDLLVLSMLSTDAAKRPRSIHEVMLRLAAVAGLPASEPIAVSHAYFTAPALVGRDSVVSELQAGLAAMLTGRGSALLIRADAGEGRSRMLDACVLLAKTAGAAVLRVNARAVGGEELGTAQSLVDALLEDLPRLAELARPPEGLLSPLTAAAPRPRLRDLAVPRASLLNALRDWLVAVTSHRPLVIACDDVHEADVPSVALLATLATIAGRRQLWVVTTAEQSAITGAQTGLAVLADACTSLVLEPLAPDQTEELLRSLFGEVPNLSLLSARIHESAAGNPRDCLDLVEHLVSTGQLAYERGHWTLPSEMTSLELPTSAAGAFDQRVSHLRPLARRLLEAQALATQAALTRADYLRIEPDSSAELDSALVQLLAEGFLESDGPRYVFARRAFASSLAARMTEADRQARHRGLALVYEDRQLEIVAAKHWLLGAEVTRGLERLIAFSKHTDDIPNRILRSGLTPDEVAAVFAHGLQLANSGGRSALEVAELQHWLVMLGTSADDRFYHLGADAWFARIARDSGLARWRELSDVADPAERLRLALVDASERYSACAEAERVYAPVSAIQYLVHYVAASLALGVRSADGRLLASLPAILEPYAALSPLIYAVWQNAEATYRIQCSCQVEQARERYRDALSRIPEAAASDVPTRFVRNAVVFALGLLEARLGIESAEAWVRQLDVQHGSAAVDGMYLRKILRLSEGDFVAAEQCRRQAELLALQENARPMLSATLIVELSTHVLADDLTGLKQVRERIASLAERYAGWTSLAHLAQGEFLRLCGYANEALEELERAIESSSFDPLHPTRIRSAWPSAVSGYIDALSALGRLPEAVRCGEAALATCAQLGSSIAAHGISRSQALVEAKLGHISAASARLDRLIAEQYALGVRGLHLGASYEARTRVAIWAGERAQIDHFGQLTAAEYRNGVGVELIARYERLMEESERAGATALPSLTDVRSTLYAGTEARKSEIGSATRSLASLASSAARAERALGLLCEAHGTQRGALYLRHGDDLRLAASLGEPALSALEPQLRERMKRELEGDEEATRVEAGAEVTQLEGEQPQAAASSSLRLLPLRCGRDAGARCIGILVLVLDPTQIVAVDLPLMAAIGEQLSALGDCA